MRNSTKTLVSMFVFALSGHAHAIDQRCETVTITTPTENFITEGIGAGYVIDSTTGLAWARCVVGQTWDATNEMCTGEALRLTWQQALQTATAYSVGNFDDWRVPNIKELASIVERACVAPAANVEIFANTPDERFWSSTPNTSAARKDEAWSVAFYNGRIDTNDKNADYYVRMVRYAE